MYPAKSAFRKHPDEPPRTDAAIRRRASEDLYLVMNTVDPGDQAITLNVVVNPLVNWVWFGFGILAFGTGIALLPESTLSFATGEAAGDEAATTTVGAAGRLDAPRRAAAGVRAAHGAPGSISRTQERARRATPRRDRLHLRQLRARAAVEVHVQPGRGDARGSPRGNRRRQGSRRRSSSSLVEKYGSQQFLAAPIDKGFNRLAWLFPYLLGAAA